MSDLCVNIFYALLLVRLLRRTTRNLLVIFNLGTPLAFFRDDLWDINYLLGVISSGATLVFYVGLSVLA